MTWTAAIDNVAVTGYRIERCGGNGCVNFSQIAAPVGTGTTYTDAGLASGTTYNYRVRAADGAGNLGGFSNTATAVTSSAVVAVAFRQLKENSTVVSSNSISSGNFGAAVGAGNLLVAWINYNSGTNSVSGLTDTAGNTYSRAGVVLRGTANLSGWSNEIWYAKAVNGAPGLALTATFSATFNAEKNISVNEYSGVNTVSPLEATAGAVVSTANASSGSASIATANDLIYGVCFFENSGVAGSGFTQRSVQHQNASEDKIATTAGSYAATCTNYRRPFWCKWPPSKLPPHRPNIPPSVPAGLSAVAVSETQVNLSWTNSSDNVGVSGYKVFREGYRSQPLPAPFLMIRTSWLRPRTVTRWLLSTRRETFLLKASQYR